MSTSTTSYTPTVLVTGCTPGGIGFELAKEYRAQGLRVIASARNINVLRDIEQQLKGIDTVQLDVTDLASIKRAKKRVAEMTAGRLDILVNNAGKSYLMPATDIMPEGLRSLFETNVFGVMFMCQQFAELLIAAQGKIVNIGSVAGILPIPYGSVYNASKAALHSYGETLRVEMKPFNVQVITIITGGVKSNLSNHVEGLRSDSLYYHMNDLFMSQCKGREQQGAQPTEEYAKVVVRQTLKPRPSLWIWSGTFSFWTWVIQRIVPRGAIDKILAHQFGMDYDIFATRIAQGSKNT